MDTDYLDHSVTITRDHDAVWRRYERLGFTLSPVSRHQVTVTADGPMVFSCTANRCAYFGESFIELIGVTDADAPDPWGVLPLIDGKYQGLRGLSFGFGDSRVALRRLRVAGLESGAGITELERPVDTPEGRRTMRARAVHVDRARTPEGIVHVGEHLTPQYLHQPRYLAHPNGARHLDEVLLVVADDEIDAYVQRYAALLDRPAKPDGARRIFRLRTGGMALVPVSALDTVLPGATVPMLPFFAAHTVAVDDLDTARRVIDDHEIATRPVPGGFAADAHGTGVIFREVR